MDERDYKAMNDELKSAEEILIPKIEELTDEVDEKIGFLKEAILQSHEEYADQFKKQLKEKEQESIMLEKMCNRAQDHAEGLLKQLTKSNEMNERLADALESSVNGLIWFQEEYPSSYSKNDMEHLTKCKDILTEYQNSKK